MKKVIEWTRTFFAIALCFFAQHAPVLAGEGGDWGAYSTGTTTVSFVISARVDSVSTFTLDMQEDGSINANAVFCLRSNIVTPLRLSPMVQENTGEWDIKTQGECADDGFGATLTAHFGTRDADLIENLVIIAEPI